MNRSHAFLASGITALVLSVVTAILLVVLAASITGSHAPSPVFPLLSALLQILSSLCWSFLLWRQFRLDAKVQKHEQYGLESRAFLLILAIGITPAVIAAIVTGATLGWSEDRLNRDDTLVLGKSPRKFLPVVFGVWGIALAIQVIHLICMAWFQRPKPRPSQERASIGEELGPREAPRTMTEANRPETAKTAETAGAKQTNLFRETPSSSSPPSLIPSEGPSSMRSSFSTLPRPASSKKGMIIRQPSYSLKDSRQPSSESTSRRPSQDEGFDSWDTSQVSFQIREALHATGKAPPLRSTGLAPIPGSRSPSPAKALEGPFFGNRSPSASPPLSPLPQPPVSRPTSPPSSPPEVPNFTSVFPPAAASPPSSPPLASPSPAGLGLRINTIFPSGFSSGDNSPISPPFSTLSRKHSEDHIHPLFRTTSPSPAPSPSLGTVVTAAPSDVGQLINERALRARMRTGSMPTSPLVRSESSPNMREKSKESSPMSTPRVGRDSTSPPPIPARSRSRPGGALHHRKRSASLETLMKMSNNV